MLVLSRNRDERIFIVLEDGREIILNLVGVHCGRARFGIEAPPTVQIHREEVYRDMQAKAAARSLAKTTTAA